MKVLIVLLLLIIAFALSRTVPGKFAPAHVFTLYWCGFIFVTLLCSSFLILKLSGIIYILIAVIAFSLGSLAVSRMRLKSDHRIRVVPMSQTGMRRFLLILTGLAFIGPLISLMKNGFSLSNILNLDDLMDMNHEMAEDRYASDLNSSPIDRVFSFFIYLAPLCGGTFYHFLKGKKWFSVISILPGLFTALTAGAKMGFITSVELWLTGFIMGSLFTGTKLKMKRSFVGLALGAVAFIAVLLLSMMFRIGEVSVEVFQIVTDKMVIYAIGSVPAFDQWFDTNAFHLSSWSFGAKTFYGISNAIGLMKREGGVYSDLAVVSVMGGSTNVFTIFRALIEDFGVIGSIMFSFVVGAFNQLLFNTLRAKRYPLLCGSLLAASYFYILWSFVISIFAYASYFVVFVLYFFVIKYACYRSPRRVNEYSRNQKILQKVW